MSRLNRAVMVLTVASLVAGCDQITGSGETEERSISSAAQAQIAFSLLKASAEAVDRQVTAPFNSSASVSVASGTAAVSGRKSSTNTSSLSSTSTSRTSDLYINFANYTSAQGTVSGRLRWFDYYYSRTACSSSTCASSSERSEAIEGSAIRVQFTADGETLSDEITVDANSPDYTTRWTVKITNRAGQTFTFSAY